MNKTVFFLTQGEIFLLTDLNTEAPFSAKPMVNYDNNQKMINLMISDYVFDTLSYVAHTHGFLALNLTKENVCIILNLSSLFACLSEMVETSLARSVRLEKTAMLGLLDQNIRVDESENFSLCFLDIPL